MLGPGDVFLNADFGYQPTGAATGSIGDVVWFDANADGVQDANEPGIGGVTVALIKDTNGNGAWDAGESIIATDTTDAAGGYLFQGLPLDDGDGDADYIVLVTDTNHVVDGLTQTFDSDGVGTPNRSAVALSGGSPSNLNQDFGYTAPGQTTGDGLIGDTIFLDVNNSGMPDPGRRARGGGGQAVRRRGVHDGHPHDHHR